jgi:FtsP/CotA-like multicopper oxidase with cupredoxin domain
MQDPSSGWNPLGRMAEVSPDSLDLVASVGIAETVGGIEFPAWMLNESLPSPLLRIRQGESFRVSLRNELPDQLILHWHGLTPPEQSDGHPRFAVRTGEAFHYDFEVENRPGTYWYHSHTHGKTAKHTALGIGGMIIVEGEEEESLGLPAGEREVAVILQDRQEDPEGRPVHSYANSMSGYLGNEPYGNGVRRPFLECDTAVYRLRVLNGSNARIFRLERSDGRPIVLIGNDGGLLERSRQLGHVDVAPAERVDLLVDLRDVPVGSRVRLRSRPFSIPGGAETFLQIDPQGSPLELMELRVVRRVRDHLRIPERLSHVRRPDPRNAVRERTFRLATDMDPVTRTMIRHTINEQAFEMGTINVRVPFDRTEIWHLSNDDGFAHPIHLHGTHFRVLSRFGGRGTVMPWEDGLKDTVLVHPSETVSIAVRFEAHRGLFLLHCHNLEHEDVGMMLNVLVE